MKKIALLTAVAGALIVPSVASASDGHGLSAGGVASCAGSTPVGQFAPVTSLSEYPGPPGPFGGPNSKIDFGSGKNNGTDLVLFCQGEL